MSKRHQYIVSSRKGQTAVHKKERRKVVQSLSSMKIGGKFRRTKKIKPVNLELFFIDKSRPKLMNSQTTQNLGEILSRITS